MDEVYESHGGVWRVMPPQEDGESDRAFLFREDRYFAEIEEDRRKVRLIRKQVEARFGPTPQPTAAMREDFF